MMQSMQQEMSFTTEESTEVGASGARALGRKVRATRSPAHARRVWAWSRRARCLSDNATASHPRAPGGSVCDCRSLVCGEQRAGWGRVMGGPRHRRWLVANFKIGWRPAMRPTPPWPSPSATPACLQEASVEASYSKNYRQVCGARAAARRARASLHGATNLPPALGHTDHRNTAAIPLLPHRPPTPASAAPFARRSPPKPPVCRWRRPCHTSRRRSHRSPWKWAARPLRCVRRRLPGLPAPAGCSLHGRRPRPQPNQSKGPWP
jgi:hypothetical protein